MAKLRSNDGLERIFTTEEDMANFDLEKLAVEYCAEYGIDRYDPIWGQIVSAFCAGAKIERERCAKIAEEFNTFPCALSTVGKNIADEMRMRSNVLADRRCAPRTANEATGG